MIYDSQKQGNGHDGNGNNIDKHRCQVLTTAEGEVWTMKLPGKQHSWQTLALTIIIHNDVYIYIYTLINYINDKSIGFELLAGNLDKPW